MKPARSAESGDFIRKLVLWASFLAISGLYAFGAAVRVDFVDPEVPLSQAVGSLDWSRVAGTFREREYPLIFLAAIVSLLFVTFSAAWKIRLGMLAAGILTPVFLIGPVMLAVAAISPLMVFGMLAGKVDGEFYGEGTPLIAAVGLWMLLCLACTIREGVFFLKRRKQRAMGELNPLDKPPA